MDIVLKKSNKAIVWLCVAHLINDVYGGFLNPIMPFLAEKLSFSMAAATVIISISHICSSMLQPLFGYFADNMLKRFFIFWGLILSSIFIPFCASASNIYLLLIFMILGSIGSSFFHPQSMGFVNYFSKTNCTVNMGVFISLGSLGFAMGPLFAAIITQKLGLEYVSYTSLFSLIIALLMFKFVPKLSLLHQKIEHKQFFKTFKEILSCKQMNYLIIIAMMKSLMTNSSCILLPFLWKNMNFSPFYIGLALFLFVFAGSIASLLSPKLEKIFGARKIIYLSLYATLPLMIIFSCVYDKNQYIVLIIFSLIGLFTMLAQPITMVLAQKTLPEYKSIVAGFINGFCWGVTALCMSLLGMVAQHFGIINTLICLSIVPVIFSYYVKFIDIQNKL